MGFRQISGQQDTVSVLGNSRVHVESLDGTLQEGKRMPASRWRLTVGILAVVAQILAGCRQPHDAKRIDRSILTDDPCAPPCWNGITPGQTKGDEAHRLLVELGAEPYGGPWGYIRWPSLRPSARGLLRGANTLHSEVASPVDYIMVALEFDLTLEEVMAKYGPPENYQAVVTTGFAKGERHPIIMDLVLNYSGCGLLFEAWIPLLSLDQPLEPGSDLVLDLVYYIPPSAADWPVEENPSLSLAIPWDAPVREWAGLPLKLQVSGGVQDRWQRR